MLAKKHVEDLKFLRRAKPTLRKIVIENANESLICCLCECAQNILKGNVSLTVGEKRALKRHKEALRRLVKRSSIAKKKRIIQKGGFLPALLAPLLAPLASAVLRPILSG